MCFVFSNSCGYCLLMHDARMFSNFDGYCVFAFVFSNFDGYCLLSNNARVLVTLMDTACFDGAFCYVTLMVTAC